MKIGGVSDAYLTGETEHLGFGPDSFKADLYGRRSDTETARYLLQLKWLRRGLSGWPSQDRLKHGGQGFRFGWCKRAWSLRTGGLTTVGSGSGRGVVVDLALEEYLMASTRSRAQYPEGDEWPAELHHGG
jgi:hypothetical protein